jgi:hypothetical protein
MLKRLQFDVYLSERRGVDLIWLCNNWSHKPTVTGPSKAVRDVISDVSHKAQCMIKKESNRTLLTLNWYRRDDPITKSIVTVSGGTIDNYVRMWWRLVCYAMRTYES